MKNKILLSFVLLVLPLTSTWSLEPYQGADYPVEKWRCGAPMVESLRKHDPNELLNDSPGKLGLKESLEEISNSNLKRLKKKLGNLSFKEQELLDLIATKFPAPVIHRTSVATSKFIVANQAGMVSATKRKAPPAVTPMIEQRLFSGHDCLYTTAGTPYGTKDYGTVIIRFEDRTGFAWGSMYTGYRWALEVEKKSLTEEPGDGMRRRFAEQIYTNNHWDEALGLFIIDNVRAGTSFRGKGAPYDKSTMLDKLLSIKSRTSFWTLVVKHRLAYLEGHFTDNVPLSDIYHVQYREADRGTINSWKLPSDMFSGANPFIQFFNRAE
jgi:hypothetical protein